MNIRSRITFLFTLVVTAILFLVCISIYYFSGLSRERAFRQRLQNRALSTFSLLLKVEGIDSNLLQKIDQSTYISIQERSVVVYLTLLVVISSYKENRFVSVIRGVVILQILTN